MLENRGSILNTIRSIQIVIKFNMLDLNIFVSRQYGEKPLI